MTGIPDRVTTVASPLHAVLDAVHHGATTRPVIATRTGLDPDVVDGAVDHLLRIGCVTMPTLKTGCPDGGCSGCGSITGSGCAPVLTIGRAPTG